MDKSCGVRGESSLAIGGWDEKRAVEFSQSKFGGCSPGRVLSTSSESYEVLVDGGRYRGSLSGKYRLSIAEGQNVYPVAGDWVCVQQSGDSLRLMHLLERRNWFSRQYSGKSHGEQVVASNLDYLFIVMGMDQDFNLKRLDRYLLMAKQGGVMPVAILTKADLHPDSSVYVTSTQKGRPQLIIHAISAKENHGMEALAQYFEVCGTVLLVGSSGAGKSTLINRLLGTEVAATGALSEGNGRGRATTTMARAYETLQGGLLIDAPGMREVQLWADTDALDATFEDISELAAQCRFRDCRHQGEPGCMVSNALMDGLITQERFLNYLKLKVEVQESRESMLQQKRKRFKDIAIRNKQRRRMGVD